MMVPLSLMQGAGGEVLLWFSCSGEAVSDLSMII